MCSKPHRRLGQEWCLAHRQLAVVQGLEFDKDQVVALYDMKKVFDEANET